MANVWFVRSADNYTESRGELPLEKAEVIFDLSPADRISDISSPTPRFLEQPSPASSVAGCNIVVLELPQETQLRGRDWLAGFYVSRIPPREAAKRLASLQH